MEMPLVNLVKTLSFLGCSGCFAGGAAATLFPLAVDLRET